MLPANNDKSINVPPDGWSEPEACSEVHKADFKAMMTLEMN